MSFVFKHSFYCDTVINKSSLLYACAVNLHNAEVQPGDTDIVNQQGSHSTHSTHVHLGQDHTLQPQEIAPFTSYTFMGSIKRQIAMRFMTDSEFH